MRPGRNAAGLMDVDDAADRGVAGLVANELAFASDLAEAEDIGQDRPGRRGLLQQQAHAVKSANREFRRHAAAGPGRLVLDAGHADQRQPHAVRIAEGHDGLAEAPRRRVMRNAILDEAMRPVADRTFRHPEHRLLGLADAEPARRDMLPRKEREDRAGRAGLVAEIEMIGAGIVEIHGLLHEPEAERARVEVEIALAPGRRLR